MCTRISESEYSATSNLLCTFRNTLWGIMHMNFEATYIIINNIGIVIKSLLNELNNSRSCHVYMFFDPYVEGRA